MSNYLRRLQRRKNSKSIPLSPEAVVAFERQKERFIEKFGREPTGNDPVFFNPDCDTPQFYNKEKTKILFME